LPDILSIPALGCTAAVVAVSACYAGGVARGAVAGDEPFAVEEVRDDSPCDDVDGDETEGASDRELDGGGDDLKGDE